MLKNSFTIDTDTLYKEWYKKYRTLFDSLNMQKGLNKIIKEEIKDKKEEEKIDEVFLKDLIKNAESKRKVRAKSPNIIVTYKGVLKTKGWIHFNATSQYTPGKKYYQYIRLEDTKDAKYLKEFAKRDIIRLLMSGNLSVFCSCLKSDTLIKLLDGRTLTVKDMEKEFKEGKDLWVYSTDSKGDFKPGKVEKVWITGTTKKYIKVTLDNGKEILTTENHPYMLRSGEYKRADELVVGEPLMPLYFTNCNLQQLSIPLYKPSVVKIEVITLEEEEPVYDIKVAKWENFYVDAGVVLHNCPDHLYAGWKYMGHTQGYGIFKETRFPKIRNPKLKGTVCKHMLAVLGVFLGNWTSVARDVQNSYYWKKRYDENDDESVIPNKTKKSI